MLWRQVTEEACWLTGWLAGWQAVAGPALPHHVAQHVLPAPNPATAPQSLKLVPQRLQDFSGLFIPLVGAADWAAIQQGFQDMDAALKERAEAA